MSKKRIVVKSLLAHALVLWSLLAYLDEAVAKQGIISQGYGDWCPPADTGQKRAPVALTSTAIYYQSLRAMQKMALALDKSNDAVTYGAKAEIVRQYLRPRTRIARDHRSRMTRFIGTRIGISSKVLLALHCG